MRVRGTSVTVVAGVIILVVLVLAGTALGVSAIVSSHSSASPPGVVVPQTAAPGAAQPAPTATAGNGSGAQFDGSLPVAAPEQGPGRGSVDVRVSQREIIVFTIGIRYYFQGGWFIITGPTTYIGTIRPPGFSGGEPKERSTTPPTTPSGTTTPATPTPSGTTPATPTPSPTTPSSTPTTTPGTHPAAPTTPPPSQPGTSPAPPPPAPSPPPSSQPSAPQGVVVPNVVGDDAATAQQVLSAAGFAVKVVGPATGTVLSQVPAASGTAPPGSTVVITLG